jgi:hypothetical protein
MYNDVLYEFQSDLKSLEKLADGFRHQINCQPKAQIELIIEYKGKMNNILHFSNK